MPNELQQTRYDQLVRRVGGIIGPGSKVAEALPELFPMVDVERVPGELLMLGGTRVAMGSIEISAGPAVFATIQLFNPANSGFLVTCSHLIVSSGSGTQVRWNLETTPLTDLSTNRAFRDGRLTGVPRPVAEIRSVETAAAVTRSGQMRMLANTPYTIVDPNAVAILAPGTGLTIQDISLNQIIAVTFFWRERVALESELSF